MKKNIYLYKSGVLSRKDTSLILKEKNGNIIYIPIEQINTIYCFGDITLNKRVIGLLNVYSVCIVFFNYYGDYIGRCTPKKYTDGKVIVKQVNVFQSEKRQDIARIIIETEIKNCISLLKYYNKKTLYYIEDIDKLINILDQLKTTNSINDMMLLEAKAKKIYYSCFDSIIRNKDFIFKHRKFQPPENEVNALLSYGYAILYANILTEIDKSPLMPQISFIHSLKKETDSLQYDIADMFKPIFIDRLVFRIINKSQINKDHFQFEDTHICYLNKEGINIFLHEYELFMSKSIKVGNKYYSYRNLLTREVYKLLNYILEKDENYKPFVMRW